MGQTLCDQSETRGFSHVKNSPRAQTDSPAARAKLKACGKPYWRAIDPGLHQGYRKGLQGGVWVARRYLGGGKYVVETIGAADDHSAANGETILDFYQAQRRAREIVAKANAPLPPPCALTVNVALDAYFERLEHEGSKSLSAARGRSKIHIRPKLGNIPVTDLTRDILAKWLTGLAGKHGDEDAIPAPAGRPRTVS